MEFQTAYGPKVSPGTENKLPSKTKQAFAEELDVNNIIKKYNKTGVLQKMHDFEGIFGDFKSQDFQDAMNTVINAEQVFLEVPSKIRAQFNNDPGAFIDFATNKDNLKQMREWGLAMPEPEPGIEPAPAMETAPAVETAPA